MILPIGHEEMTVRRLPWVTFGLIASCIAVHVGSLGSYPPDFYHEWGLVPIAPTPVSILSYMFVHGGWIHLLGNLFMLFLAGPPIEDRWGRPVFAAFYLAAGVASAGFYMALAPESPLPLVGASGAIAGVMGACLVRHAKRKIRFGYFFFFVGRIARGTFWAPAWAMLPLWFANELLMASIADSMGIESGIAYWAHVGGFAFGTVFALSVRQLRIEERFLHPAIEARITLVRANPAIEEALELREQGDLEGAYDRLARECRAHPDDTDVATAFWDVACAARRAEEAAPTLLRRVRAELASGGGAGRETAARFFTEVAEAAPHVRAEPALLLRLAPVLLEMGERDKAVLALRHAVDPAQRAVTPGAAMRALELARELDPPTALAAARRALDGDLHEAKREKLEELVAELEAAGISAASAAEDEEICDPRAIDLEGEPSPPPLPETLAQGIDATPPGLAALEIGEDGELVRSADSTELMEDAELPAAPPFAPLAAHRAVTPPPLPSPPREARSKLARPLVPPPLPPVLAGAASEERLPEDASVEPLSEDDIAFASAAAVPRRQGVKVVDAVPVAIEDDALSFQHAAGRSARLAYGRIQAIAVAAVEGLAEKPVLLVDLLLNWRATDDGPLRIVRLRSDAFDVRTLVPEHRERPMEAFRALVDRLLERSGADPLPGPDAARGRPFARFRDPVAYHRGVLQVDP